jgi:hypothetical protein
MGSVTSSPTIWPELLHMVWMTVSVFCQDYLTFGPPAELSG